MVDEVVKTRRRDHDISVYEPDVCHIDVLWLRLREPSSSSLIACATQVYAEREPDIVCKWSSGVDNRFRHEQERAMHFLNGWNQRADSELCW